MITNISITRINNYNQIEIIIMIMIIFITYTCSYTVNVIVDVIFEFQVFMTILMMIKNHNQSLLLYHNDNLEVIVNE